MEEQWIWHWVSALEVRLMTACMLSYVRLGVVRLKMKVTVLVCVGGFSVDTEVVTDPSSLWHRSTIGLRRAGSFPSDTTLTVN